ncbi:HlyD family secretion protein [Xanthomonas theicola]|uniref:Multidrug ABC transporter permease n=1 Tax=Xanthomonas theicola TaxID=56464 RepID=A0A2S6ZDB7_9XANT|nr:HlyD family secretion protein [Xanthomonas theicola]PPT88501.1 multidrug ABC transporter permease [Xanthomonas theicola]QNH25056.1 HlyD family secretion protein [Xanthomonas theicola]
MSIHDPDPAQTQRQATSDDARAAPAQDDGKQADKPSPLKNPKVKWTLLLIGLVVLIALAAWLIHYLTTGRYLQETNNAYLQADSVAVAPRVNGYVTAVYVGDNQTVKAGQPLLQIDERTYRATQQQAQAVVAVRQADIAAAEAGLQAQRATLLQARTQVTAAAASLRFAQGEAKRFAPLAASGADTHEHYESIVHDRDRAQAQSDAAKAQVVAAESQVQGASAQLDQALAGLQQAQADADQAAVAMEDTRLTARIGGRIGDKTVQVGQFVAAGTRLMSVVPVDALYLSANFKETQVGLMRPGQPARIEVDALSGVELDGVVESIAPGTGSQFALLPPENATGNFTKVVQRVPVRIRLQAGAEARKVLVPGMSVTVTVDTRAAKDLKDRVQQESKQGEGRP